jgi:hypothetical protein
VQLTDTSLKIKSYVAYFATHEKYQFKKGRINDISVITVIGNTLKDESFISLVKRYKDHFYIVFDNVICVDNNGIIHGTESPGRIDIF